MLLCTYLVVERANCPAKLYLECQVSVVPMTSMYQSNECKRINYNSLKLFGMNEIQIKKFHSLHLKLHTDAEQNKTN